MKISLNWLRQYVRIDLPPEEVAELLTNCGLEVENMEKWQSVKGGLSGVVIGEVLTCRPHPNADHLTLTTVTIGSGEPLHIVCGAPNVAVGQKVPVAPLGTTLWIKDKEMIIQRTKLRGELSEGMICSEDELGLGESHAGIMVLDSEAIPGTSACDYFKIEDDTIFEIGLTPNRSDASSHIGIARDFVAVWNNRGGKDPKPGDRIELTVPDVSSFAPDHRKRKIDVVVEDASACPRYSGLTLTNIQVGESPVWLKNRLLSVGLHPINNIVDITNFVLMESGQPLHAFDADQITGDKVVVKKYPAGTPFISLDGQLRELTADDLMICNTIEPMCIAGVFGGLKSGVTETTRNLFLESACFDPRSIRRTARHHGLQTDASFRFERGTDIDITSFALKRAALLIRELAGGEIASNIVDIFPSPPPTTKVIVTFKQLDRLIGQAIPRQVVKNIMRDLGITILHASKSQLDVSIPSFKMDVTREVDVIEEVLRIYGYNNIELPSEVRSSLSGRLRPDPDKIRATLSELLTADGFFEIITNSLSRQSYYENNPDFPVGKCIHILNPISRELNVMRQTLLYGGLETILFNRNRKTLDLKLFEFGSVYSRSAAVAPGGKDKLPGFHEEQHLAFFLTGCAVPENWNTVDQPVDLSGMKGYLNAVFTRMDVPCAELEILLFPAGYLTNGYSFQRNGIIYSVCGEVSKSVLHKFDIKQPVFFSWLNIDTLIPIRAERPILYQELPKYPEVRRDLALLLDKSISFDQIRRLAFQTVPHLLKKVGLFDVYEGDSIESGKKSYALSFILQHENKTLTDQEIDQTLDQLIQAFRNKFQAKIR